LALRRFFPYFRIIKSPSPITITAPPAMPRINTKLTGCDFPGGVWFVVGGSSSVGVLLGDTSGANPGGASGGVSGSAPSP